MSKWQPIETAPQDGRYIISGRIRNGDEVLWVKLVHWATVDEIAEYDGGDPSEYEACWSDDECEPVWPTHWMPLPEPPK